MGHICTCCRGVFHLYLLLSHVPFEQNPSYRQRSMSSKIKREVKELFGASVYVSAVAESFSPSYFVVGSLMTRLALGFQLQVDDDKIYFNAGADHEQVNSYLYFARKINYIARVQFFF